MEGSDVIFVQSVRIPSPQTGRRGPLTLKLDLEVRPKARWSAPFRSIRKRHNDDIRWLTSSVSWCTAFIIASCRSREGQWEESRQPKWPVSSPSSSSSTSVLLPRVTGLSDVPSLILSPSWLVTEPRSAHGVIDQRRLRPSKRGSAHAHRDEADKVPPSFADGPRELEVLGRVPLDPLQRLACGRGCLGWEQI